MNTKVESPKGGCLNEYWLIKEVGTIQITHKLPFFSYSEACKNRKKKEVVTNRSWLERRGKTGLPARIPSNPKER